MVTKAVTEHERPRPTNQECARGANPEYECITLGREITDGAIDWDRKGMLVDGP